MEERRKCDKIKNYNRKVELKQDDNTSTLVKSKGFILSQSMIMKCKDL